MSDLSKAERIASAMASPGDAVPRRRSRSIRRTSNLDALLRTSYTEGASDNDVTLTLSGSARDLVTHDDRTKPAVAAEASVVAGADTAGQLLDLSARPVPAPDAMQQLLGRRLGRGFRDAIRLALPDEVNATSPLALLLDELPVAALISGYARLYDGGVPADEARTATKADICSGWRSEGFMMTSVRDGHGVPVTVGPTSPPVSDEVARDPDGWHPMAPLAAGAMRRRRLVDVCLTADTWQVFAMFRDTHVGPEGDERVLHEYSLTARIDPSTHRFEVCRAVPRVLPFVECPVAAASADRLVGQSVDDVRSIVRSSLRGISTCTHLNDLLRSLGDVPALVAKLVDSRPGPVNLEESQCPPRS